MITIQELSFDEVDQVGGGVVPILIGIAYVGIGLSAGTLALGGGFVVGLRLRQAIRN